VRSGSTLVELEITQEGNGLQRLAETLICCQRRTETWSHATLTISSARIPLIPLWCSEAIQFSPWTW
jgi:hypothetical protein